MLMLARALVRDPKMLVGERQAGGWEALQY